MQEFSNKAVVYSQNNCQACNTAVSLLESNGYVVDIRKLENGYKEEMFKEFPTARSVPQVMLFTEVGSIRVGGLDALRKYL